MSKVYRLEDDLLKKSRPKWNSKRFRRLETALHASGIRTVMVKCEKCGKMLLNPHSILIHQGGFCQKEISKIVK